MQLRIVPLSGMGGPYALKDEDGPPGYTAQWIKDEKLAYMFAAAPEMYEALKTAIEILEDNSYYEGSVKRFKAILAKAEGKTGA